jgi:hypothetical protein
LEHLFLGELGVRDGAVNRMTRVLKEHEIMTLFRREAAVFALCWVTMALDCGGSNEYLFQSFELPKCPDTTFSLPKSAHDGPYELSRVRSIGQGYCPGFRDFTLRENDSARLRESVRLNRGAPCVLVVGLGYAVPSLTEPAQIARWEQWKKSSTHWMEVAAQLVMQGSGVAPTVPAAKVDRLTSNEQLRRWCKSNSEHAFRPCGEPRVASAVPF